MSLGIYFSTEEHVIQPKRIIGGKGACPARINCATVFTKCRQSLNLCWQHRRKNQIITRKFIFSACLFVWCIFKLILCSFMWFYAEILCCFVDIWKNFASSNARFSYNTNVHSIDRSPVFIGILWINVDDDLYVGEMGLLIIALIIIVQNTTKQLAFVLMEMSKYPCLVNFSCHELWVWQLDTQLPNI